MTAHLLAAAAAEVAGEQSIPQQIADKFGWNPSLFLSQLLLILVAAVLLKKFAFGPILIMLEQRQKAIAQGLENAEKIKVELARAEEERRRLIGEAGAAATKIIEEARNAAAKITEAEMQKAVTAAQNIIEKARQSNEAELTRMKAELRKEVGRLVVATSAKVTGKILTTDDQQRLADDANRQLAA